jgi:GNAT superfamily N-acetyltransferase
VETGWEAPPVPGYRRRVIEVRRAHPGDADELLRLRAVMLAGVGGEVPEPGQWRAEALRVLGAQLARPVPRLAAFVVPAPDHTGGLVSCAVGTIELRLGGPDNPRGEVGHVFDVATDPGYRRRGYSRACLSALLDWYRSRGIPRVDLNASSQGMPLYLSLGFLPITEPALRLRLPAVDPGSR